MTEWKQLTYGPLKCEKRFIVAWNHICFLDMSISLQATLTDQYFAVSWQSIVLVDLQNSADFKVYISIWTLLKISFWLGGLKS